MRSGRRPIATPEDPRSGRPWVPSVAAGFCVAVGLADLAAAVTPSLWGRVRWMSDLLPGAVTNATVGLLLAVGIGFLVLAGALARRKRRAYRLTVALLAASVAIHVVEGPNWLLVGVSGTLLAGLLVVHREFYAAGDPYTRWRAVWVFVVLIVVAVLLGLAVVYTFQRPQVDEGGWPATLGYVVAGLVGVPTPLVEGNGVSQDVAYYALLALGLTAIALPLGLLLASPRRPPQAGPDDERRMRALLSAEGERDSLGYFALRRDKGVVWSRSGKSCVAYGVTSGVMLASGDPLGDPEAWPGAIQAFLTESRRHAWIPAVVACSETGAEVWCREAGLEALEIGDEAIVHLDEFSLEGRAMRNVRQMVNRVRRAGYGCSVRRLSSIPQAELAELRRLAGAWRVGDTERGFSMALGRLGDAEDGDCVLVTAEQDGCVRGLIELVPWGRDGLSLDLMRRAPEADPGVNDLLIVQLLEAAGSLGVRRVSLNFAVFRSALARGERIGAAPLTRAWRRVLLLMSRWAQIESLYRFNAKFQPVWEPRFILYPDVGDLPRVTVAYLEAEAFLSYPGLAFWRSTAERPA